jgi:hypothetical protein
MGLGSEPAWSCSDRSPPEGEAGVPACGVTASWNETRLTASAAAAVIAIERLPAPALGIGWELGYIADALLVVDPCFTAQPSRRRRRP